MAEEKMYALARARVEVMRCRRALDTGSPPRFWLKRLTEGAKKLEAAAAILRMQICEIEARYPDMTEDPQTAPQGGEK